MCDRFFALIFAVLCLFSLSSCQRQITCAGDELCMNSWYSEFDNGTSASLTFNGDDCTLTVSSADYSVDISGLYVYTDDTLLICDRNSDLNYSFGYTVYGDRAELSYNGSVLSLEKL